MIFSNSLKAILSQRKAVIWALVNREIKTRLGDSYFGYAWIIFEPMLHVTIWFLLFSYIRHKSTGGLSLLVFILTGVITYFLFAKSIIACMNIISANKNLLNYQQVKMIDSVVARILLEVIITIVTFIIGLLVLYLYGDPFYIYNPLRIIGALILCTLLSFGAGLVMSVACYFYIDLPKFIPVGLRLIYFTSGVFFTAQMLPKAIREYVIYNPIYQIISIVRSAFTPGAMNTELSYEYVFLWSIFVLTFGISCYFVTRKQILMNIRAR